MLAGLSAHGWPQHWYWRGCFDIEGEATAAHSDPAEAISPAPNRKHQGVGGEGPERHHDVNLGNRPSRTNRLESRLDDR
jgi:hypothetical protein